MPDQKKKYRINQLLSGLPMNQYKKAIAILPAELGVSVATFNNYRNIGIGEEKDIPHGVVVKLEAFFGLQPGELQNYEVDIRPISNYKADELAELATTLNLGKR